MDGTATNSYPGDGSLSDRVAPDALCRVDVCRRGSRQWSARRQVPDKRQSTVSLLGNNPVGSLCVTAPLLVLLR